jgi:hypothetical protein
VVDRKRLIRKKLSGQDVRLQRGFGWAADPGEPEPCPVGGRDRDHHRRGSQRFKVIRSLCLDHW